MDSILHAYAGREAGDDFGTNQDCCGEQDQCCANSSSYRHQTNLPRCAIVEFQPWSSSLYTTPKRHVTSSARRGRLLSSSASPGREDYLRQRSASHCECIHIRIFGKQLLLHNKNETRAVVPAERKVPSLSFSVLLRKQLPKPLF